MRYSLVVLIVILTTGCSPRPFSTTIATQPSLPTDTIPAIATPDSKREEIIALAIEDLSTRLSLKREQVRLLTVESAEWADEALGCPRPGEAYTEQAELGYLIVLEANGQIYQYRADTGKAVILCDSVVEESSSTKDRDQNVADGWPNETKNKDVIFATPIR